MLLLENFGLQIAKDRRDREFPKVGKQNGLQVTLDQVMFSAIDFSFVSQS